MQRGPVTPSSIYAPGFDNVTGISWRDRQHGRSVFSSADGWRLLSRSAASSRRCSRRFRAC